MDTLYLPLDTETGGIGKEVSLLTAYFAVCDKNLNILDDLDLAMRPNNGQYITTAEALSINKIDLIKHDKLAITYGAAGIKLRDFLIKNSQGGKVKLVPIGKNVSFDVIKITDNLLGRTTWNQYVSVRTYDLSSLIIYLKRLGRLPRDAPDSLEGLGKYFGYSWEAHTAKGDTLASIEVLKKLESL